MATTRTGHTGSPRPAGYLYPREREQRCLRIIARLDRVAAAMNMTREQFLERYGSTPARRNAKASTPKPR